MLLQGIAKFVREISGSMMPVCERPLDCSNRARHLLAAIGADYRDRIAIAAFPLWSVVENDDRCFTPVKSTHALDTAPEFTTLRGGAALFGAASVITSGDAE